MKFATVDTSGKVTGFYEANAPKGAIGISDEVWIEWLEKQFTHRWRNGKLVEAPEDIEGSVSRALVFIDAQAEAARLKYLTPGIGQALTYRAKAEEIRRYDEDTNPVKSDYPYMTAEIGITGDSLTAVADAIRAAVILWAEKGPEIERTRLKAKADVVKAETVKRIDTILAAIEWP